MTQEFFGAMALSLSLLACFGGVYFTVWAGALSPKMPGLKVFGIAATAIAVFILVFTSYCLAQMIFMQRQMQRMMSAGPAQMMKHDQMMHKGKNSKPTSGKPANPKPTNGNN
jgi:hypothetical protein